MPIHLPTLLTIPFHVKANQFACPFSRFTLSYSTYTMVGTIFKKKYFQDMVGVIYAVGGQTKSGNSLSTVEVYNPTSGRWRDAEAMSMLRSRVGVAVMQNRLFAIGGYNGQERLNTVEVGVTEE